jgi:hypothetical protein
MNLEDFRPTSNNGGYSFSVFLEPEFAQSCLSRKIGVDGQQPFQKIGAEIIMNCMKETKRTPYIFAGDSLLVDQCSLGRDGKWLSTSHDDIITEQLEYRGHNLDNAAEAYTALSLFATWIEYAEARLGE